MRPGRPSLTARWIAAHRTRVAGARPSTPSGDTEGERRLYESMGRLFVLPGLTPTGMATRTTFIDGEVARAIGQGTEQIVIVGAGYDGRSLRFGGGATRWWEVDFPATQADKIRRLRALGIVPTNVAYAGVDLMTDDLDAPLNQAGHDVSRPTLFICEGLLGYLTLEANASLCRTLRARAAPGSALTVTVGVTTANGARHQAVRHAVDAVVAVGGEPRRTRFHPGDVEKLMVVTGWSVVRSATSARRWLDEGSQLLVVACAPSPTPS